MWNPFKGPAETAVFEGLYGSLGRKGLWHLEKAFVLRA